MLHAAHHVVDNDEVANHKRFVDGDRQRGKQVAQDVLHRQCDGDAANAQAGNQGRDVEPQVVEHQQQDQYPDHHPAQEGQQRQGHGARALVFLLALGKAVFQPENQAPAEPEARLQNDHRDEGAVNEFFQTRGQRQKMRAQVQASGGDQQNACGRQDFDQEVINHRIGGLGNALQMVQDHAPQGVQQQHEGASGQQRVSPVLRAVVGYQ